MDEEHINLLKGIKDREIVRLLAGISRFFNSKFPPEMFNIKPVTNEKGYHMNYLNVGYTFNFVYEGSLLNPKGKNITFSLDVELDKKRETLEQMLNENKISNKQLDKTKYLAEQKINSNGECVEVSCRIKKIPYNESDLNDFCCQLWDYVVKNVFSNVHKV